MSIQRLLGENGSSVFPEYFLRSPFACAGGCRALTHYGDWERIDALLKQPGVDVIAGDAGGTRPPALPQSAHEARTLLSQGFTVGIRHAERHDEQLAELARGFQEDFLAPVDVHVYCTAAGRGGFGWHYDAEDVFVLQTAGTKDWELRKNTVHPWPLVETLPPDMHHECEIMPLLRCTLRAGDWIYVPAGYWHRTRAETESISLSIGILSPAAILLCDFLREYLRESLLWRQRLPPAGALGDDDPEVEQQQYKDLCARLVEDLRQELGREEVVQAFMQYRRERYAPGQMRVSALP